MEHRWSARKKVNHNTVIFNNGIPVSIGQLRDISQGGTFVNTSDCSYRRGMCLELEFVLPSNGAFARHRLSAVVRHVAGNGIGLMFKHVDHQARQDIIALSSVDRKHKPQGKTW